MSERPAPMLFVRSHELPQAARSWLDAGPLPEGVRALRRSFRPNVPLAIVLGIPFGLGLIMALNDLALGRWQPENGALLAVFLSPFLVFLAVSRWQRRLATGPRRWGLLLGAEALLWAPRPGECSLIPRRNVVEVQTVKVVTGKASHPELRLVFLSAEGQRESIQLEAGDLSLSHAQLVEALETWREAA